MAPQRVGVSTLETLGKPAVSLFSVPSQVPLLWGRTGPKQQDPVPAFSTFGLMCTDSREVPCRWVWGSTPGQEHTELFIEVPPKHGASDGCHRQEGMLTGPELHILPRLSLPERW